MKDFRYRGFSKPYLKGIENLAIFKQITAFFIIGL